MKPAPTVEAVEQVACAVQGADVLVIVVLAVAVAVGCVFLGYMLGGDAP